MIHLKHLGDERAIVAGYGIVFNTTDLEGDRFGPETDFGLYRQVRGMGVYYDHGMRQVKHRIGQVREVRRDETGLFFEVELERHAAYVAEVLRLIEQGALGFSTGALPHLVERQHGMIKRWILGEISLTPAPAEPRCLGVQQIKALEAAEQTGQTGQTGQAQGGIAGMHEQHEQQFSESGDMANLAAYMEHLSQRFETVDSALKRFETVLDAPARRSGFVVPETRQEMARQAEVKAFERYIRTGIKAAMEVGTPAEGGYLVPTQYSNELVAGLKASSILRRAGARVVQVQGANSFKVPTITHGGAAVLTDEEAAFDEKEPTVGEAEFKPYKYTRLAKVSDELLQDSRTDVISQVLLPDFVQAFAAAENIAFSTGTGSNQPQGVVTGGSAYDIATADFPTADELIDFYHSLSYLYRENAVWLMSDTLIEHVRKLKEAVNGQYIWQPGLQADQPDRLLGRPVYTVNALSTTKADDEKIAVFGDMRFFWIVDFAQEGMKRLDELYASTGQVGFRAYRRVDSKVMLSEAIKVLQI